MIYVIFYAIILYTVIKFFNLEFLSVENTVTIRYGILDQLSMRIYTYFPFKVYSILTIMDSKIEEYESNLKFSNSRDTLVYVQYFKSLALIAAKWLTVLRTGGRTTRRALHKPHILLSLW